MSFLQSLAIAILEFLIRRKVDRGGKRNDGKQS